MITASAAHKGTLTVDQVLEVDADGGVVGGAGRPSAETLLHTEIVEATGAGAVLHTHSVWSTILSGRHEASGGFGLVGLEMLKGLRGVTTHEHREWVPVVPNSQDMPALAAVIRRTLAAQPAAHAVLIGSHGLYTWGEDLAEAERHIEILEFLFEVEGRRQSWPS
jgi:methylthioribulose-1-phosphate dehydratase